MAGVIRYRRGINATNGKPLVGAAHLAQSLHKIWMTRLEQMPMLLALGSNLYGLLGEDVTPAIALAIYNELVASAARWEPEYAITQLQLVHVTQDGSLGLQHSGLYYPEGRYGNYDLSQPFSALRQGFGRIAA
ncbi:integrase [Metarhizobium album]|uniref:Integrase n=1 Tax=Metarhizobium album TaxID=2182425 RepID=A0A2U2DFR0_9HYPH|nr:integrase [Rhizobium album]PWE52157.1 integrase [Rhizobium album]